LDNRHSRDQTVGHTEDETSVSILQRNRSSKEMYKHGIGSRDFGDMASPNSDGGDWQTKYMEKSYSLSPQAVFWSTRRN
jgi:hypothetical protein